MVSEFSKTFSGYQPHQVVQQCLNRRFDDHLCPHNHRNGSRNIGLFTTYYLTQLLAGERLTEHKLSSHGFTNRI